MMADRHKRKPIAFRPPEGDHARLTTFAAESGRPVNAILTAALAAFLDGNAVAPQQPEAVAPPKTVAAPREAPARRARVEELRERAIAAPAMEGPLAQTFMPKPAARRRCPHPGTRVTGGWCPECEVRVLPGGYLPD